ncbi:MAG: InlB B-repeat-containing protein [Firmicutes bacterium]|nr:InlB B-repeat-containing protein [Bacillota bacterium]
MKKIGRNKILLGISIAIALVTSTVCILFLIGGQSLGNISGANVLPALQGTWQDDGFVNTSWFTDFESTRGSHEFPFLISTPQELAGLARLVNGVGNINTGNTAGGNRFANTHIRLASDINLSYPNHRAWIAIGGGVAATNRNFRGIFDGNGHSITLPSELRSVVNISQNTFGLFGQLGGNAVVRNLTLHGNVASYTIAGTAVGNPRIGSVAGAAIENALVEHITSHVNFGASAFTNPMVGGIIGIAGPAANATPAPLVRYVVNHGNITGFTGTEVRIGGIAGEAVHGARVHDAINHGNISGISGGGPRVGGVFGHSWAPPNSIGNFRNLVNTGNITVTSVAGRINVGGVIGNFAQANITANLVNHGTVIATGGGTTTPRGVGGIIGFSPDGLTILNSFNNGNINGHAGAAAHGTGGIIGRTESLTHFVNVFNTGTITGRAANYSQILGNRNSTTAANAINFTDVRGDSSGLRRYPGGTNQNLLRTGAFTPDYEIAGVSLVNIMNNGLNATTFANLSGAAATTMGNNLRNLAVSWIPCTERANLPTLNFPSWPKPEVRVHHALTFHINDTTHNVSGFEPIRFMMSDRETFSFPNLNIYNNTFKGWASSSIFADFGIIRYAHDDDNIHEITSDVTLYAVYNFLRGTEDDIPFTLATPENFSVNAFGVLSWDVVPYATNYRIYISDREPIYTTDATFDLMILNLPERTTYTLSVRAIGDGTIFNFSDTTQTEMFYVACTIVRTVTFKSFNQLIDTQTTTFYDYNFKIVLPTPANPNIARYTFAGWQIDGNGQIFDAGADVNITSDTEFVALWNIRTFDIHFNDGEIALTHLNQTNIQYGIQIILPTLNDTASHIFAGWVFNEITHPGYSEFLVTRHTQFVASWTIRMFNVLFQDYDTNLGGLGLLQDIPHGTTINLPNIPTERLRESHTFQGWRVSGQEYIFDTDSQFTITSNTTFQAAWQINRHSVVFRDDNGAIFGDFSRVNIAHGDELELPFAERIHHDFLGWRKGDSDQIFEAGYNLAITIDIIFEAVWQIHKFNVYFQNYDNTALDLSLNDIAHGTPIELPPIPYFAAKDGYVFTGWVLDGVTHLPETFFTVTRNVTFIANWTILNFDIAFYDNGSIGEFIGIPSETPHGAIIILPNMSKTGYAFIGWFAEELDEIFKAGYNFIVEQSTTFIAIWEILTFNLTFRDEDGTQLTTLTEQDIRYGYFTLPDLPQQYQRESHSFLGWRKSGNDLTFLPGHDFKVAADTIFEAVWGINQFTLTFRSHGSTLGMSGTVGYGHTLTLPSLENTVRYTFGGWQLYGGSSYQQGAVFTVRESMRFDAVWTINTFNLTFTSNDEILDISRTVNHNYGLMLTSLTNTQSHTFGGWLFEDRIYHPGTNFTVTNNMEFKAIWNIRTFNVLFKNYDGTLFTYLTESTVEYGNQITLPNLDDTSSHIFGGWVLANVTYLANTQFTVIENTTFMAIWETKTFNIYFEDYDGISLMQYNLENREYGSNIMLPILNDTESHTFSGWGLGDKIHPGNMQFTVTGEATFVAIWRIRTFDITFKNDNDTEWGRLGLPDNIESGTSITLPNPPITKASHTFVGWIINQDGITYKAGSSFVVKDNIIFVAVWKINRVNIIFQDEEGNNILGNLDISETEEYGFSITLPTLARENYHFLGWIINNTGLPQSAGTAISVTGDTILRAAWVEYHYVIFSGINGEISRHRLIHGQIITQLPAPTRQGYRFDGWLNVDGIFFDFSQPITATTTLTASWSPIVDESNTIFTLEIILIIVAVMFLTLLFLIFRNSRKLKK